LPEVTAPTFHCRIISFLVVPLGKRFSAKTLVGIPKIFASLLFLTVMANTGPIGSGQSGIDISRLLVVLDFAPAGGVDRYMGLFMTLYGVRVLLGGILGAGIMQMSSKGSRTALAVACFVVLSGAVSMMLTSRRASGGS